MRRKEDSGGSQAKSLEIETGLGDKRREEGVRGRERCEATGSEEDDDRING